MQHIKLDDLLIERERKQVLLIKKTFEKQT